jgi:hypothetical protein
MHEEQVNVAGLIAVPAGGGPEDRSKKGLHLPPLELDPEPFPKLRAKVGERDRDFCGDVLAVELVDLVTTHPNRADDALFDKPSKASPDPNLGTSRRLLRDLPDRQRTARSSEHRQHRTI